MDVHNLRAGEVAVVSGCEILVTARREENAEEKTLVISYHQKNVTSEAKDYNLPRFMFLDVDGYTLSLSPAPSSPSDPCNLPDTPRALAPGMVVRTDMRFSDPSWVARAVVVSEVPRVVVDLTESGPLEELTSDEPMIPWYETKELMMLDPYQGFSQMVAVTVNSWNVETKEIDNYRGGTVVVSEIFVELRHQTLEKRS